MGEDIHFSCFAEFIKYDDDRIFGLYFDNGTQIYPMTIKQYVEAVLKKPSRKLCLSMCKLIENLERDSNLKNIDVKNISPDMIIPKSLKSKISGTLAQEELQLYRDMQPLRHLASFPPNGYESEIIHAWIEMKEICDKLLKGYHQSPYRIVLSYCLKSKMTITSRSTSKENLIPYLHTPVVTNIEPSPGDYYGSPDFPPSTETLPHWIVHAELNSRYPNQQSAIIHGHPQELLRILEFPITTGLNKDTILPHEIHGTQNLGLNLARYSDKRSVIIKGHGVWTFGNTFGEAYQNYLELMIDVRKLLLEIFEDKKLSKEQAVKRKDIIQAMRARGGREEQAKTTVLPDQSQEKPEFVYETKTTYGVGRKGIFKKHMKKSTHPITDISEEKRTHVKLGPKSGVFEAESEAEEVKKFGKKKRDK